MGVPNPKAKCSGRGDFFKINKQKYCQTTGPDITTTKKALKVLFKSNKKSEGGLGGYCTAKCMSEQPTTEANSTSESGSGTETFTNQQFCDANVAHTMCIYPGTGSFCLADSDFKKGLNDAART